MAVALKLLITKVGGRRFLTPGSDTGLDASWGRVIDAQNRLCKYRDVPAYNVLRRQLGKRQLDTGAGVCVTKGENADASLQEPVFLRIY